MGGAGKGRAPGRTPTPPGAQGDPGAAAGGEPSGRDPGARSSFLPEPPDWGAQRSLRLSCAPTPGFPVTLLLALPHVAVTSRPRPGTSRLGLRAAAWADWRPWDQTLVSGGYFFEGGGCVSESPGGLVFEGGVNQGVDRLAGVHARLPGTFKEERAGNRVFVA